MTKRRNSHFLKNKTIIMIIIIIIGIIIMITI